MRKQMLLLLTGFWLAGTVAAQTKLVEKVTKKGDEIVIPYEKYKLKNGLTLIIHEDHSDPLVRVDVTYHVGSAREEIGKSGFAHFFEHMMFQGSDHVADEEHFKIVTESGGTLNGTTNRDRTNYFETVPNNQLEKMLWLEADRMGFLLDAVTQQKFEIQRATVKNERGQNYDNRPYGLAFENISRALYPYGHPYSWLTIGYVEDLDRVNADDLKNFFLRWYGPNNATLTVGGDVNPKEVIKLVEKYFGPIPAGPKVEDMPDMVPTLNKHRFVSYVDNYARVPILLKVYPTVPNYNQDMAALDCLAEILGQGNNSVLYQQLVKNQQALAASASHSNSELSGEFMFQIVPYPGKSLADMYSLLNMALDSFEARGVTDDDIARFKAERESDFINGLQSVSGKVAQLAAYQTFAGNPNMIQNELKMYRSVTKEDVMRVYNQYIKMKHCVVLSILTKGQEDLAAGKDNYKVDESNYQKPDYGYEGLTYNKAKDNFDRSKQPGSGPNPMVKVPDYWKADLGNGVKAIGTENTELPLVTISVKVPGGHLLEANDLGKAGVADFFADMMGEDTKEHTAEEFSQELDKLGSSIRVNSDLDGIEFQVSSLKKNLDATLALLQERMLQPKFTEDAFTRLQKQRIESFKQIKSQPAAIASIVFNKLLYGANSILGTPANGTEESIKALTLGDIQNYYDNYMTSEGTEVVVVGDVTESEIKPKLAFLQQLPDKKIELPTPPAAPDLGQTKIYLVDVPNAAQTEFRVGYNTGLKYDATGDYYRAYLANFPMGGAFNSRINLNLREDKGWTYGASTGFSGDKYSGTFYFRSGIKAPATDSALTEVMNELKTYNETGVKPEELAFMKSALGQIDALRYETGFQKAGFLGRILEYDLPANYVEQQSQILKNMTEAEMNAFSKRYFDPKKMNILLVGDKKKILPTLEKFGYEIVELDADGNPVGGKGF